MFAASATTSKGDDGATKNESANDQLADKTVFLQLLVSQIKYQNPLEPADSIQYVTQLNQFSATEQLVEIRKLLEESGKTDLQSGGRL
jgi:flagellar basal-body rod modification protein FlgD